MAKRLAVFICALVLLMPTATLAQSQPSSLAASDGSLMSYLEPPTYWIAVVRLSLTNTSSKPIYLIPEETYFLRDEQGRLFAPVWFPPGFSSSDPTEYLLKKSDPRYSPFNPGITTPITLYFDLPYGLKTLSLALDDGTVILELTLPSSLPQQQ